MGRKKKIHGYSPDIQTYLLSSVLIQIMGLSNE